MIGSNAVPADCLIQSELAISATLGSNALRVGLLTGLKDWSATVFVYSLFSTVCWALSRRCRWLWLAHHLV